MKQWEALTKFWQATKDPTPHKPHRQGLLFKYMPVIHMFWNCGILNLLLECSEIGSWKIHSNCHEIVGSQLPGSKLFSALMDWSVLFCLSKKQWRKLASFSSFFSHFVMWPIVFNTVLKWWAWLNSDCIILIVTWLKYVGPCLKDCLKILHWLLQILTTN